MIGGHQKLDLIAIGLSLAGVDVIYQLLLSAAMCVIAAWLGQLLHKASLEPHGEHEFGQ